VTTEREVIKWLVEVLHYPFDVTYDTPPPVDLDALADHWNEWDGWGVAPEEARACVREEAGVRNGGDDDYPEYLRWQR
jgi:hypothetical protein